MAANILYIGFEVVSGHLEQLQTAELHLELSGYCYQKGTASSIEEGGPELLTFCSFLEVLS